MESRSGRRAGNIVRFAPLLLALIFSAAAAAPVSLEKAYKDANAAMNAGDLDGAMKIIDQALATPAPPDSESVWALEVLRATIFTQQRRYDEARAILEASLPPNLRNSETAVRQLVAMAMIDWYSDQKRPEEAVKSLKRARDIALRHGPALQSLPLRLLATLTDDVDAAEQTVVIAKKVGEPLDLAKAEITLFLVYTRTGRNAEAVRLAETIRPRLEAMNVATLLKSYYANAGWMYSQVGDYDQAIASYKKADRFAERAGDLSFRPVNLTNLGNAQVDRGDLAGAARTYGQVLDALGPNAEHRSFAQAKAQLARVQLELGDPVKARKTVTEAIQHEVAIKDTDDELIARMVEARIDIATGRYENAVKILTPASNVTTEVTRIEARDQLGRAYAGLKKNDLARKMFEDALQDVRALRKSARNDLDTRLALPNLSDELLDDYVDFLVGLGRSDDALRLAEASRAQALAEDIGVGTNTPVDPRALAKARNATILSYSLGRRRSYLWTITASEVRLTPLPIDRTINAQVERYRDTLDNAERGVDLYKLLVEPAKIARNSRVIIVPDGSLHTLNFETLVSGPGPRYWIEDVTIANASSLQILGHTKSAVKPGASMLLVGDPQQADAAFPRLAQASKEIESIRKQFRHPTILTDAAATPAAYLGSNPGRFEFIHFVAHGTASRVRPLDSAVILSRDAKKGYRLLARDVATQKLTARLVTISSCQGAGSATYAGEGLIGLAWAFRRAGAQQVIAALWEVTDVAAPRVMDAMYQQILRGSDPASALRKAKLDLLHSKSALKQPKHWAPFVIYV